MGTIGKIVLLALLAGSSACRPAEAAVYGRPGGSLAPATPTTPGSMSAADKSMIDSLRSGWETKVALFMQGLDTALTQCGSLPLSPVAPTITAPTSNDGNCEGGCAKANNGGAATYIGPSVAQAGGTAHWALTYRSTLLGGGASGHDSEVGLINAAGSHVITVMRRNASSTTKYTMQILSTGTQQIAGSINADSNPHDQTLYANGTSLVTYVDQVADVVGGTQSNIATEPLYLMAYSQTAGEAIAQTPAIYCFAR